MNGFRLEKMIVSQLVKKFMSVVGRGKYRVSSHHGVLD
jgi:hypothetical protein